LDVQNCSRVQPHKPRSQGSGTKLSRWVGCISSCLSVYCIQYQFIALCPSCVLQLTREYNLQCLYLFYPVLKQHIHYEFEPCDNDTVDKVTADHASAVVSLSKEAKRWAARIARETNNIREYTRKLQVFQQLRDSGQKVMYDMQSNIFLSSLRN